MTSKRVRAAALDLIVRLPELPRPWDIEALCQELERTRRQPLTLHFVDLPVVPFGVWYDTGAHDYIFCRSSATGYYRDHIILHEICHMLAGHGTLLPESAAVSGRSNPFLRAPGAKGAACSDAEEELAETFASFVLKMAGQRQRQGISAVQRRAEELLGATSS